MINFLQRRWCPKFITSVKLSRGISPTLIPSASLWKVQRRRRAKSHLGAQYSAEVHTARRVSLPAPMTSRWHQHCLNLPNGLLIRHSGQSNCCCVWIRWNSDNKTLYTTGLFYEHRHGVVKFSNVSGTSTTDTVQKGWLNWPWSMLENDKPSLLRTLLANANCGWHNLQFTISSTTWGWPLPCFMSICLR